MKKNNKLLFSFLLFVSYLGHAQEVDIIIKNGKISTLDSNTEVQALAVSGNKILKTGTDAEILKLKG